MLLEINLIQMCLQLPDAENHPNSGHFWGSQIDIRPFWNLHGFILSELMKHIFDQISLERSLQQWGAAKCLISIQLSRNDPDIVGFLETWYYIPPHPIERCIYQDCIGTNILKLKLMCDIFLLTIFFYLDTLIYTRPDFNLWSFETITLDTVWNLFDVFIA